MPKSRVLPLLGLAALSSLMSPAHAQETSWKVTPFGSIDKLLASTNNPTRLNAFPSVPVEIDAVRGEYVNFQFVITAGETPITSLSIEPTSLATIGAEIIPLSGFSLFRENYVYVAHPSGNRIKTPQWWPDALVPLSLASQTVEAGGSAVYWASVRIPNDAAPGEYYGELDIVCNGQPKRLALTVDVRNLSLPPSHFRATAALYYDSLRDWYKKSGHGFSDADWQIQKQRYADFLLNFGINPYDPPVTWNDAAIDAYLQNPRVHSVRTPPLDSPDVAPALAALKRTNTLAKAFYYWNDEPQTPDQFAAIRQNATKLRELGIPQLVTAHPSPELGGAVDIWCPNVANALTNGHLDIPALKREQAAGHATWLYTMVIPKHPYPTWLLDDDSSAILSYALLWVRTGATGFVYSMVHGWGPHPLQDLTSFANTNGDGTLLYPAELVGGQGPMPSIRLMLLRDAIEDYAIWEKAKDRQADYLYYSFPARRSQAIGYRRAPALDALENKTLVGFGNANVPLLFPETPESNFYSVYTSPYEGTLRVPRSIPYKQHPGFRSVTARLSAGTLAVDLHGAPFGENDLVTVIVERSDIEKQTDQWRLYFSKKGLEIQKRTLTGRFEATLPTVRAVKTATGVRFWIPLSALNITGDAVRFNVSWQNQDFTFRLFEDANDPFLVPLLKQPKKP